MVLLFGWIVLIAMLAGIFGAIIFGNRFVCGYICPRRAFFDIFISRLSKKLSPPSFISNNILKITMIIILFGFFILNLYKMPNSSFLPLIFWKMCFITTLIGIILAFFINERSWCMICPIGSQLVAGLKEKVKPFILLPNALLAGNAIKLVV